MLTLRVALTDDEIAALDSEVCTRAKRVFAGLGIQPIDRALGKMLKAVTDAQAQGATGATLAVVPPVREREAAGA